MKEITIGNTTFTVLKKCKTSRELVDLYKNIPAKQSFPEDVLDTSSYCRNGVWLHNNQFVLDYHTGLENLRADIHAKRTRVLLFEDGIAYTMGFTVEHEGKEYLAVVNFGLRDLTRDFVVIELD